MATLNLNILIVPTYNTATLAILDASTYPDNPAQETNPTIEIMPPGFDLATIAFDINNFNIFTSDNLGITAEGTQQPLPDGAYHIKYSVAPSYINFVEKTIFRVERLQERYDEAFMKLDMMECDKAIKAQSKIDLMSIYIFINGAIAAANNCALVEAHKLYDQADKMLCSFMKNDCGCYSNNYLKF